MQRALLVMITIAFCAACGGGGQDQADEPHCSPPTTGTESPGPTTTPDPRCVGRAVERTGEDGEGDDGRGAGSTWEGSFTMTSTGPNCTASYDGDTRAEVAAGGSVTATMSVAGSYTCEALGEVVTIPDSGSGKFQGSFDGAEFRLIGPDAPIGPASLASVCFSAEPRVVPVENDFASTEWTVAPQSGDVYTCKFTLDRVPT